MKARTATELAYERTRVAYERTMMAWIRTATSLMTFGFSVYKFFQIEHPAGDQQFLIGTRAFGLWLDSLAFVALFIAILEYRGQLRTLGVEPSGRRRLSLSVGVAVALAVLSLLTIIAMAVRA